MLIVPRSLGAFIGTTTFIRDKGTLLQIRQFAQLRSASCSMQGFSPTQRSAHATPSRDLTLGVVQQKEPQKTINPEVSKVNLYLSPGWCCYRFSLACEAARLVLTGWSLLPGWFWSRLPGWCCRGCHAFTSSLGCCRAGAAALTAAGPLYIASRRCVCHWGPSGP